MLVFVRLLCLLSFLLSASARVSLLRSVEDALVHQGTAQLPLNDNRKDNDTGLHRDYAKKYLRYASFGDSWSSGVNYGSPSESLEYNFPNQPDICRCRRVNEAWPVQLRTSVNNVANDTSLPVWTGGRELDIDFVACFAAYFEDIPSQIQDLDQTYAPEFATLTLGGNPGGFPELLFNCVFWPDSSKDYGPEYPDPEGECWKAVQHAKEMVRSRDFTEDLLRSVALILTEPRIRQNPDFKLYVLGYAELFNEDDAACDEHSFGVWADKKPLLKQDLRREINGIITTGRHLYERVLNSPLFGDTVQFVDIDHLFEGHRFCERITNGTIEQQNEKSWLYSLQFPTCTLSADNDSVEIVVVNITQEVHDKEVPGLCRRCGSFMEYGEFARPFHPKPVAHEAIARHLSDKLSQTLRKPSTQPYADILALHGWDI